MDSLNGLLGDEPLANTSSCDYRAHSLVLQEFLQLCGNSKTHVAQLLSEFAHHHKPRWVAVYVQVLQQLQNPEETRMLVAVSLQHRPDGDGHERHVEHSPEQK